MIYTSAEAYLADARKEAEAYWAERGLTLEDARQGKWKEQGEGEGEDK